MERKGRYEAEAAVAAVRGDSGVLVGWLVFFVVFLAVTVPIPIHFFRLHECNY